ncbi:MAG: hypothetical protein AB7R40_00070 [Nitrospiraceae bacterium]
MGHRMRLIGKPGRVMLAVGTLCLMLSSCQYFSRGQLLFDRYGIEVGLQPDPSVPRSSPPAPNAHPIDMPTEKMALMLSAIRVSGWSGTLVGYFESPRQIPLFDDADLRLVAAPIAQAFREAAPTERVFFYLPNPKSAYGDATAGSLFIRDSYLHVVITDHKAFARADTAGGDEKDARDTKGMRLWIAPPYKAAEVPPSQEPDWAPFETVHLSVSPNAILARNTVGSTGAASKAAVRPPAAGADQAGATTREPAAGGESPQDLKLQIRELTQSNLDLRDRLNEQTRQVHELKDELARLRGEMDRSKPKSPPARKSPSP